MDSYDYVEDADGTVYVLRAYTENEYAAVLYPAYQRKASGLERILHTGVHAPSDSTTDWLIDAGCVIRSRGTISVARPWNSDRLLPDRPGLGKDLTRFIEIAQGNGARLYAYGSRLLGRGKPGSDWDLLFEGLADPIGLVEQVVEEIQAARYRTDSELASLFTLPRLHTPISGTDLVSVLRGGLPYFYIDDVPVDLMARGPTQVPLLPQLEEEYRDVVGTIEEDIAGAYSMPRRLELTLDSGDRVSVFFLTWFIQGLGRMGGQRVSLQSLRQDSSGNLWFASKFSRIALL